MRLDALRVSGVALGLALGLALGACAGNDSSTSELDPTNSTTPTAGKLGRAAAACATGADCIGGTCLGAPGQLQYGNKRFDGGYCTALGCTENTQEGCGPDEYCLDFGTDLGPVCIKLCSKADGLQCERADQVCLGLGSFGGCFSRDTVECDVPHKTGCQPTEVCSRIGYDDRTLGRCETLCDPLNDACPAPDACYFIRTYSKAFCNTPGTLMPEQTCACDKCCVPGYACTPDLDGSGRHCKEYCSTAAPTQCAAGEMCVPTKDGSPYGGCVAPGSAGT